MAECIAGFDLNEGDAAFTAFMEKLRYVQDHSWGSVDKPCEDTASFEAEDVSSGAEDDSNSSDSDSTSVEEAFAFAEDIQGESRFADINSKADMSRIFRHVRTKMLHFARTDDMHKTCCGRIVGDTFTIFKKDPENAWPKCRVCFGR